MVRLLVLFRFDDRLTDFRLPELQCVARTLGVPVSWDEDLPPDSIFLFADFESLEGAVAVVNRCTMVRGVFELWARGPDYPTLLARLHELPDRWATHVRGKTFKYVVESFGRSYPRSEQLAILQRFHEFGRDGVVAMESPDTILWILENIGHAAPATTPPREVFFARQLHLSTYGDLRIRYDLKRRPYLGTTSMPADLSFLMANMAGVLPHHLVMDCFCGTASLLVAAAHLGAHCYGVELDPRVLRGRKEGVTVFTNFPHYGLETPEFVRGDMARRFFWRAHAVLDAIVTDPPYGTRAGSRRVDGEAMERILQTTRETPRPDAPIVPTEGYALGPMLRDLMDFAARSLVMGGRLVFWMPTTEQYSEAELPAHPCLTLRYNSGQPITLRLHRRLLTYEKVKPFEGEVAVAPQFSPDVKHLDYHSDTYLKYKAKVDRRREASRKYKAENGIPCGTRRGRRSQPHLAPAPADPNSSPHPSMEPPPPH